MYDGLPENYSDHLQDVGQELMNGSLDKVGAVIRLVRFGWNHEEAHAAVTEMLEQVETTKKLLRDAQRVLDDSPSGQARASARLREAGFSTNEASNFVQQLNQQRHVAVGRVRDVLRGIRTGKLGRQNAVEQLSSRGMDEYFASTIVDIFTDSATYWSIEWMILSVALCAGALLTTAAVATFSFNELYGWLGVVLGFFITIPILVTSWSWKNWKFWGDWTLINQSQRECPRSCSPMVMLMEGKGRASTTMTSMEWGLSRETATEIVRRRADLNVRAYLWITLMGVAFVTLALGSSIFGLMKDPGQVLSILVIDCIMACVGGVLIYRGMKGWICFSRK
ncbi:MAG TPA: hypothetical protein PLN21_03290 [Gemmatales bacterium]|nr:hypothetical protein [Gemmatales bacterium]